MKFGITILILLTILLLIHLAYNWEAVWGFVKKHFERDYKHKITWLVLPLCLLCAPAWGATWYVDSSIATSGNGTSWATPWKALSNVSGVKAGDTVYISGGPARSSQTYAVANWKPTGGSAGNPITYQVGQDVKHNGTVVFSGSGTWLTGPSYCVISGDSGDGATHFVCQGYGTAAAIGGTTGLHIEFVNLGSALGDGFDGQGITSFDLGHCYAYISSASADHFLSCGFNDTSWDGSVIHDCTIFCPHLSSNANGADFFQMGGNGYSLRNNLLVGYNTAYTAGQHQDGWQGLGNNYITIVSNTFLNVENFAVFGDAYYGGFSHIRVLNNLFLTTSGAVFGTDGGYQAGGTCTFNDIVIANNTADCPDNGGQPFALNNVTSFKTAFTACAVTNNVTVNGGGVRNQGNTTSTFANNVALTSAQAKADFVKWAAGGGTNNDYHLTGTGYAALGNVGAFSTNAPVITATNPPPLDTNIYVTNIYVLQRHVWSEQANFVSPNIWISTGRLATNSDTAGIPGTPQMILRWQNTTNWIYGTNIVIETNPPPDTTNITASALAIPK